MNCAREAKAAVRRHVRVELERLSATDRAAAAARVCALLFRQPIWKNSRTVLLYAPLPDELDISAVLETALQDGKLAALLRYNRVQRNYAAFEVTNRQQDLQPGYFGVLEPGPQCREIPLNQLDLTLIPGVAFSFDGGRVGRGKGFYDRLLPLVSGVKCGVAFDHQVLPTVPLEPHDIRLNCILTPTRWLQIAG